MVKLVHHDEQELLSTTHTHKARVVRVDVVAGGAESSAVGGRHG